MKKIISKNDIESRILSIRNTRITIDADLAEYYGVTTKRLNEQVKRNVERFPRDFMFQLTLPEKAEVVAKCDHLKKLKYSPMRPYVFTEHGAVMLASIIKSRVAMQASVQIVRAFIRMREWLSENEELLKLLNKLKRKVDLHDMDIRLILQDLRALKKGRKPGGPINPSIL